MLLLEADTADGSSTVSLFSDKQFGQSGKTGWVLQRLTEKPDITEREPFAKLHERQVVLRQTFVVDEMCPN